MQTAYTTANLFVNPAYINLSGGDISGLTLLPGLYKFTTNVNINAPVYLSGDACSIFVFQISGDLILANYMNIALIGGVLPSNVFWVVAGAYVDIGTNASFQGTVLSKGAINLTTGATVNGRLLSQTAITLEMNTVVIPAPTA